jgi:hypothetical protein
VVYLLFARPLVRTIGHPSFLGWAIGRLVVLYPLQFGLR